MTDLPHVPNGTIDAHVHVGRDRYGPIEPYVGVMDRLGIAGAVLVARQWQFDNGELLAAAATDSRRFRVVAAIDVAAPDAVDVLDRLVEAGIAGIRIDPGWLELPSAVWARIRSARTVVSLTPRLDVIAGAGFGRALAQLGDAPVRLEHLGGIRHAEMSIADARVRAILGLAERANVTTMWSGFWLNAGSAPPYATAHDILRASLDAFGPDRISWSGDWNRPGPPIGSHIADDDYASESAVPGLVAPGDERAILRDTAARLFGFRPDARQARARASR